MSASRPPSFEDYQPPRTTAQSGVTMLVSGFFAGAAVVVLMVAIAMRVLNLPSVVQIVNLLLFAVALLLLAIYVLVWEIALRLIARGEE